MTGTQNYDRGLAYRLHYDLVTVRFNVPLDVINVISETIFPANHTPGAKTQSLQLLILLVLVNQH